MIGNLGPQVEAHGRPAAVSCVGPGDTRSARGADAAVGGEPRAAALRAVPPALLHGEPAKRRIA